MATVATTRPRAPSQIPAVARPRPLSSPLKAFQSRSSGTLAAVTVREAIKHYENTLGAKTESIMHWGDMPGAAPEPWQSSQAS